MTRKGCEMGYMVRDGDSVRSKLHTYKIVKELNQGAFAFAYKATDESGTAVFFKQYKSPSKLVPWFKDYFAYEDELNRRLREDPVLKTASIYANEVFLGLPYGPDGELMSKHENIYQVFPFVEGNINLDDMISKKASSFDWEKRLYASTVFAFALRRLHEINIVHCDLKPENVQIREDPTIVMKYRPLLIDMDWSVLSDRRAPWHGAQGYVGTVGYMSPEHIRGEAPQESSDVFTAAIILSQVLADAHPFESHLSADDLDDYVLSGKNDFSASGVPFKGEVTSKLGDLLMKALSPIASVRPTMEQIHMELMDICKSLGGGGGGEKSGSELKKLKLVLRGDVGEFASRAKFRLDQNTLARVSSQANFADRANQFSVEVSDGGWLIVGNPAVTNPTTLNGIEIGASPTPIKDGDIVALKGRSSGKTAMKLTVRLVAG